MQQSKQSAVIADFLAEHLPGKEERDAFVMDVAEVLAAAEALKGLEGTRLEQE